MQNADIFHPPLPSMTGVATVWSNLQGASVGLALSQAITQSSHPMLIIAPDSLAVTRLLEQIEFFSGTPEKIVHFPDWETLPYDHFSPHQDIISERLAALYRIPSLVTGAIITTVATLMHRLPPRDYLDGHSFLLKIGDRLNMDVLRTRLNKAGYQYASQVREHGEFAIRGSIIDLFPMGSKTPYRIDFFDNEVDSIRIFSPDTQRSMEKIPEIRLLPAKEFPLTDEAIEYFRQTWRSQFSGNPLKCPIYQDISEGICSPGIEYYLPLFFDQTTTLFDYLPEHTHIATIADMQTKATEFWQDASMRYEQARHDIARPLLEPTRIFVPLATLDESLQQYPRVHIQDSPTEKLKKTEQTFNFMTAPAPSLDIIHKASQPLAPLQQFVAGYTGRLLFCAESTGRREVILQLFSNIALAPHYFHTWQEFLASSEPHGIVVAPLEEGFMLGTPTLTVLTETQLYGKRVMQRRLRKKTAQDPDALIRDLTELQIR